MLRSLSQRPRSSAYDLPLSSPDRHAPRQWWARLHTRRTLRLALFALFVLFVVRIFVGLDSLVAYVRVADDTSLHSKPPLYEKYHQWELQLPQHNPDLPFPEGRNGQYLWIANHVHASGWGNAMQEHLLNAHLAYKSGRSFVFDNYTWNKDGSDYSDFSGHLIPSRVPLAALIRGPAAGGLFPPGDPSPRAVAKEYFDQVCPKDQRQIIKSDEITDIYNSEASKMLETGVEKLKSLSRCVEIDETSFTQIFNIWLFGSTRVLSIWDSLKTSPILTEFRWSQLIEDAFTTNRHLFSKTSWWSTLFSSRNAYPYDMIPGLLVLHIRRGDFEEHCMHFATYQSEYNGFNQFPELPEHFDPPARSATNEATEEGIQTYLRHCFPNIPQIVQRVKEVRGTRAGKGLKYIYIMTNGKKPWVAELKDALAKTGGWEKIASSRDLVLSWEQQYVAQSVDMLVGQRAQALIGNGFSSLTSNIVMLRMAQDFPPDSNRFW